MSYKEEWEEKSIIEITEFVTDYVANGSFASLSKNVNYKSKPDYAVLIRLTDFRKYFKGDFVYIDKNAYNFLSKSKLYGGEIIISNVGAYVGTVFKAPQFLSKPMSLGPNALMLKTLYNDDFYYYWLKSPQGHNKIISLVSGSAHPKFNKTSFRKLKVPVPPLPTQNRIASILSAFDEKIEVNRQMNTTLEAMAQTMFREMCLPNDEENLEDDWEWRTLKDDFNLNMGQSPKGSTYNETGEGMIFFQGKRDFEKRFPTIRVYTTEPKRIAEKGDCLLSVRAPVGTLNIALEKCCIGRGLAAISHKNRYSSFCFYTLQNFEKEFISYDGEGTVFGSINKTTLGNLKYCKPPNEIIENFERVINAIDDQIKSNTLENQTLAKSRDLLLPKLMNGEIEV